MGPSVAASAFDPVVGDVDGLGARINALRADGFRVLVERALGPHECGITGMARQRLARAAASSSASM